MKKKNLFLIALLCAYSTLASAYTVTQNSDGSVTIDGGQWVENTVYDDHGDAHTEVSGASGAGLPDSFTTDELATIRGASKLILTGYIDNMKAFQAGNFSATTVDMSEAHFQQNMQEAKTVTYDKYDPETKETSSVTKTYMKNVMLFHYFANLSTPILSKYVETISKKCFDSNPVFTSPAANLIPSNIKFIDEYAFDNVPITSITIPATVEYINLAAFQNGKIKAVLDVYVLGFTAAAFGAFDKEISVGQTNASNATYATLHFPPGKDYISYFINMNDRLTLDISTHAGKFQTWLNNHYNTADNGWQHFVNSGSGDSIPTNSDVILLTFSDNVPRMLPVGFRAYLVQGVTGNAESGFTMTLKPIFAIPANTGVILYGEVKKGSTGFILPELGDDWVGVHPYDRTTNAVTDPYLQPGDEGYGTEYDMTNYLVADVQTVQLRPYILNSNNEVTDRNFIMSRFSKTDLYANYPTANEYIGFFRVKAGPSGTNKAYLSLPANMYTNPEGAEVKVVKTGEFRNNEWNRDYDEYGDWGDRSTAVLPAALVKSFGEPFSSAIMNVEADNEGGDIYTLQGVKVSAPQKGIYLRNGKKYLVK